jgi:hypothetical protein
MSEQRSAVCPPSKRYIDDESGTRVVDGLPQITTFCGVRLTARSENGSGGTAQTFAVLLVPGSVGSWAFSCPQVPFLKAPGVLSHACIFREHKIAGGGLTLGSNSRPLVGAPLYRGWSCFRWSARR